MLVLGIDPGSDRAGFGLVKYNNGKAKLVSFGIIRTERGKSEQERLLTLYQKVRQLFTKSKPDCLALESLFFATNAKTAMIVGQARGVILLAAGQQKKEVFSYAPLEVKSAITGYGKAEKNQVQRMVKSILRLTEIPRPDDAADALAIALTHCFSYKTRNI